MRLRSDAKCMIDTVEDCLVDYGRKAGSAVSTVGLKL